MGTSQSSNDGSSHPPGPSFQSVSHHPTIQIQDPMFNDPLYMPQNPRTKGYPRKKNQTEDFLMSDDEME